MNKRRIDEIRGRLKDRRPLHFYMADGAMADARENKRRLFAWTFEGDWHDAYFVLNAADDIRLLLGEIDRLESERAETHISAYVEALKDMQRELAGEDTVDWACRAKGSFVSLPEAIEIADDLIQEAMDREGEEDDGA